MADPVNTRPFAPFEWMLALRYLRARRKEGFISVIAGFSFIGIMLAVATLIIVMSVMNGFRTEIFNSILGLNGHIAISPLAGSFSDYDEVTSRIRRVAGVTQAFPVAESKVLASTEAAAEGIYVRAVREDDLKGLGSISSNILPKDSPAARDVLNGFDASEGIIIGSRLANRLRVVVGDPVTLIVPRGASTPFGTTPRTKAYQIRGIFEVGMPDYDSIIAFMPLPEAQKFFNLGDRAQIIEVLIDDPDRVDDMLPLISAAAGGEMHISDWRSKYEGLYKGLVIQRNMTFVVLSLIVLVAALNIISGLFMLVKDKGRDIGILRTMGASRGAVMRVFFVTGASIGVFGTLAGLILGVIVGLNIEDIMGGISHMTGLQLFPKDLYLLSKLPSDMNVWEVVSVVIMALGLSFAATLYPSWRAARLDPVEALRYE